MNIPDHINDLNPLAQIRIYQDLGLRVLPLRGKQLAHRGLYDSAWEEHQGDDFLNKYWANGKCPSIGVASLPYEKCSIIIIDMDGRKDHPVHEEKSRIKAYINLHETLKSAPIVETTRGFHFWVRCPNLPKDFQKATPFKFDEIEGEIRCGRCLTVAAPSADKKWVQSGNIPEISYVDLCKLFPSSPFVRKSKYSGAHPNSKENKAWKEASKHLEGDLSSLNLQSFCEELKLDPKPREHSSKIDILCPWSDNHGDARRDSGAAVGEGDSGMPWFKCHHNSCEDMSMRDLLMGAENEYPGIIDRHCAKRRRKVRLASTKTEDGRRFVKIPRGGVTVDQFAKELAKSFRHKDIWLNYDNRVVRIVGNLIQDVDQHHARGAIEEVVHPYYVNAQDEMIEKSPSSEDMKAVLKHKGFIESLPKLKKIINRPFPVKTENDGWEIPKHGFNRKSGVYVTETREPEKMSPQQAKEIIFDAISEVPFLEDIDKYRMIASMIDPFFDGFRTHDDEITPLVLMIGNDSKVGKDAARQLVYKAAGWQYSPKKSPSDEAEWEKFIVGQYCRGVNAVHLEELPEGRRAKYHTEGLRSITSAPRITGRILGRSESIDAPNTIHYSLSTKWSSVLDTDLQRRSLPIRLHIAGNPEEKIWKRTNFLSWMRENEWRIFSAIWTLVVLWIRKNQSPGSKVWEGYDSWAGFVGGVMETAGLPNPIGDGCWRELKELGVTDDRWAGYPELYRACWDKQEASSAQSLKKDEVLAIAGTIEDTGIKFDKQGEIEHSSKTKFMLKFRASDGKIFDSVKMVIDKSTKTPRFQTYKFSKLESTVSTVSPLSKSTVGKVSSNLDSTVDSTNNKNPRSDRRMAQTVSTVLSSENYAVYSGADEQRLVQEINNAKFVAVDIETYGKRKNDGLNPRKGHISIISLCCDSNDPWYIDVKRHSITAILKALEIANLIFHNARFDLGYLRQKYDFVPAKKVHDTRVMSNVLWNGLNRGQSYRGKKFTGNSLEDVVLRELGITLDKTHQKSDWSQNTLFQTEMIEYACNDVRYLLQLVEKMTPKLAEANLTDIYDLEMELQPVVVDMEYRGLPVDGEEARRLMGEINDDAASTLDEIKSIFGEMNPLSPKQLKEALASRGISVPNTSKKTLIGLIAEHPEIELILTYKRLTKLSTSGIKPLVDHSINGRVHGNFNPLGTHTGRFSCTEPGLQTIPRGEVRKVIRAAEGRSLIFIDYSGIELRAVAAITGEQGMLDAFNRGEDLHKVTASRILNKPIDQITKDDRQIAKGAGFGLLYGSSAKGLREYCESTFGINLTEDEARKHRAAFFNAYPKLAAWHDSTIKSQPEEGRTRINRRRLYADSDDEWRRYSGTLSTQVQGSCADGLKMAMMQVYDALPSGAHIVGTVHDEIIIESSIADAEKVQRIASGCMIDAMHNLFNEVKIEVECK